MQESSINFLITLVDDVLDLTKIQFSQFQINESWFSLHELCSDVIEMC